MLLCGAVTSAFEVLKMLFRDVWRCLESFKAFLCDDEHCGHLLKLSEVS